MSSNRNKNNFRCHNMKEKIISGVIKERKIISEVIKERKNNFRS